MYVNITIDLEDAYDDLSLTEKRELAEWLYNDDIIPAPPSRNKNTTLMEDELIEKLSKIMQSYVRLTPEQIETIEEIYSNL